MIMMSAIGVDGHDAQLKELASAVVDEAVVTTDNGGEGGGDPGLGALGVASAASVSFGEDDLSAATTPRPKGGFDAKSAGEFWNTGGASATSGNDTLGGNDAQHARSGGGDDAQPGTACGDSLPLPISHT